MIPPRGFKSELYPLRHRFVFGVGLNATTTTQNSTMLSIIRGSADTAMNNPNTIEVNPHNANFLQESGALCHQMSIIDRIQITMKFTLTEDAITDGMKSVTCKYMPIFNSFAEKLSSTDKATSATAASVMELIYDATNQDVTPLYNTVATPVSAGASDIVHPVSTVNDTEVFGDLNLTTNTALEGITWSNTAFFNAAKFFTNKGAINALHGNQKQVHLTDARPTQRVFIDKFVPRQVRRIVDGSYFGMMFHVPTDATGEQDFYSGALTTAKPHVGIRMMINYHEWNADHIQDIET